MTAAIILNQLSKSYHLKQTGKGDNMVLNSVSWQFNKGEITGIIGTNGCGKSTLLKLIAGLSLPSSGTITVNGKLAALIELGSGFHWELNGMDNIYYYAQILGFKRKDIEPFIDSIIAFSEITDYINEPVKTYSKGMFLRLAYSIVAHLDFDIYLFDEVFAVGDKEFKKKCISNLIEKKRNGKTILITGHDYELIESICDDIMLLKNGALIKPAKEEISINNILDLDKDVLLSNCVFTQNDGVYEFECTVSNIAGYDTVDLGFLFEIHQNHGGRFIISSLDSEFNQVKHDGDTCNFKMQVQSANFNYGYFTVSVVVIKDKSALSRNFPDIFSFTKTPPNDSDKLIQLFPGPLKLKGIWSINP